MDEVLALAAIPATALVFVLVVRLVGRALRRRPSAGAAVQPGDIAQFVCRSRLCRKRLTPHLLATTGEYVCIDCGRAAARGRRLFR